MVACLATKGNVWVQIPPVILQLDKSWIRISMERFDKVVDETIINEIRLCRSLNLIKISDDLMIGINTITKENEW